MKDYKIVGKTHKIHDIIFSWEVEKMEKFCRYCGSQLYPGEEFCSFCGKQVVKDSGPYVETSANKSVGVNDERSRSSNKSTIFRIIDPLRQFFKNPTQWISMIVLAVLWFILSMLVAQDINPWIVKVISFLTFAQAGMYGGVVGALGGIIGKAIFAYVISLLITSLLGRRKSSQTIRKNLKTSFTTLTIESINQVAPLVLGMAMALIAFNFLTGNGSLVNGMAGILGLGLSLKSLVRRNGFIWSIFLFIANKLSKARVYRENLASLMVMGYGVGSILGIILSIIPWPYLSYMVGSVFFLGGLIFSIILRPREVVV